MQRSEYQRGIRVASHFAFDRIFRRLSSMSSSIFSFVLDVLGVLMAAKDLLRAFSTRSCSCPVFPMVKTIGYVTMPRCGKEQKHYFRNPLHSPVFSPYSSIQLSGKEFLRSHSFPESLAPKPDSLSPKPHSLAPKPESLSPKPHSLSPKPYSPAPSFLLSPLRSLRPLRICVRHFFLLVFFLCFCFSSSLSAGIIVNVTELSDPPGIVNRTTQCDTDDEMSTLEAPMVSGNYRFCYWDEILPTYPNTDMSGRAVNPYTFSPYEEMTVTAHYLDSSIDSDSDGIADWFEQHYYQTLANGAESDSDGDGYTLIEEYRRDYHPNISESILEGGVTIASSATIDYISDLVALSKIYSEPAGLVTATSQYVYKGTLINLPDKAGANGNYRFVCWKLNGVRQADVFGRSVGGLSYIITENTDAVAHYVDSSADTDDDGVADWFEYFFCGNLDKGADYDGDGDGYTLIEEYRRDYDPNSADLVLEGGVTIASSAILDYNSSNVARSTVKSDPDGIFATTWQYVYKGTVINLPDKAGANGNYRFICWKLNGVRQTDEFDRSLGGLSYTITENTEAVAHYLDSSADSDSDGIADWFEYFYYGNLGNGADYDGDGDGYTLIEEYRRDYDPNSSDLVLEGGVTIASSAVFDYDAQFYDRYRNVYLEGDASPLFFSANGTDPGLFDIGSHSAPALGDWDGDGDFDLFIGAAGGIMKIYENRGTPFAMNLVERAAMPSAFPSRPSANTYPTLGDWNGDGLADFAVSGDDGILRVYASDGAWNTPLYAIVESIDTGASASVYPAFADVNGDAKKDLIALLPDGKVRAYVNTGSPLSPFSGGTVLNHILGVAVENPTGLAAIDIDSDGDDDIIASTINGRIWEFINLGGGSWWLRSKILTGTYDNFSNYLRISAGDIDGDGDIDFLGGYLNGGLVYLRNPDSHLIIRPAVSTVLEGSTLQFECLNPTGSLLWSLSLNASGGTINPSTGLYTAGSQSGTDCITASDGTYEGNAWVNVIETGGVESPGKAIIVAGRRTPNDSVWPLTSFLAEDAYQSLTYRGFMPEDICYMSYDDKPGKDMLPSSSNLNWALSGQNHVSSDETSLVLYLVDHGRDISGEPDGLFLMSNSDTLSGSELDAMLDAFSASHPQCKITVIADACYSGDFIQPLYEDSPTERLLISSTGQGELTHFISGGLVSFSKSFWGAVSTGANVADAFVDAFDSMIRFQTAEMHDPGDLSQTPVGLSSIVGSARPVIGNVCEDLTLVNSNKASLWVSDLSSTTAISRVWGVVIPPNYMPSGDSPVTTLSEIEFAWNSGTKRWEAEYGGFDEGTQVQPYVIIVFAQDLWGGVSLPAEILVNQDGRRNRVIISANGGRGILEWLIIKHLGRSAYNMCIKRKIPSDDIRFLCEDTSVEGAYSAPSATALQDAILNWSKSDGDINTLTIFLVGQNNSTGLLCENNDVISPAILKAWLDTLQATSDCEVRLIVDSCYSNDFLACADVNYPRIILTTAEGQSFLKMLISELCFSHHFWKAIERGDSIKSAFDDTCKKLRLFNISKDFSLDDDGDGIFSKKDGDRAAKAYIGPAFLTGDDPTSIGKASAFISAASGEKALIWASDITTASGEAPAQVWAEVLPPGSDLASPETVTAQNVPLVWNSENERYQGEFSAFGDDGIYNGFIYAGNPELPETVSAPVPIRIYYNTEIPGNASSSPLPIPEIPIDGTILNGLTAFQSSGALYRFEAEKDKQLSFEVFGIPQHHDCSIELIDGNMNSILLSDDWGKGFGESIWSWAVPQSGWYYLRVKEISGSACSFQIRGFIEYDSMLQDIFENDDSIQNASYIGNAKIQKRSFHNVLDTDWAVFYAIAGHSYLVETFDEEGGCDTSIGIYRADASQVIPTRNENPAGGGEELIFNPTQSQVYYAKISNLAAEFSGTARYSLRITDLSGYPNGSVFGAVKDTGGNLLSCGSVSCNGIEVPIQKGEYLIPCGAGTFTLNAELTAYRCDSAQIVVSSGGSAEHNFIATRLFELSVISGSGGGCYASADTVALAANPPPLGYCFSHWTATAGSFSNSASPTTNFTMPASDATATANFAKKRTPEDFDGDGKSDVFAENSSTGLGRLHFMNGKLVSSSADMYQKDDLNWLTANFADFDGDKKCDMLWRLPSSGKILAYKIEGANVASIDTLYSGGPWLVEKSGDFNSDGKDDILWKLPGTSSNKFLVNLMNGMAVLSSKSICTATLPWEVKKIADFDGDGKDDIFWLHSTEKTGSVYFMNGNVILGTAKIFDKASNWEIKLYGDFDGNGATDILMESLPDARSGLLYLMKNRNADGGAGLKSSSLAYLKTNMSWKLLKAGDFNGDGKSDILWENPDNGQGMIWLMNGIAMIQGKIIYTLSDKNPVTKWKVVKTDVSLDFNNDGKTDLLWENGNTKKVLVYVMDGFNFTSGTVYGNGASWNLLLK